MSGGVPSGSIYPTPGSGSSNDSGTGGYQLPAPGAENAVPTSSSNDYNPQDPYDLGPLAGETIIWGGNYQAALRSLGPDKQATQVNSGSDAGPLNPNPESDIAVKTAKDAMTVFMSMYGKDRANFNGLRMELANAGYYGNEQADRVVNRAAGMWDAAAMKSAMQDWLRYSTQTTQPLTFVEWLAGAKDSPNQAANTGGSGSRVSTQVTDPAYLAMYAQRAARASLGRTLTPDELQGFISQFHSEEQNNQVAAANGQPTVGGSDARSESINYIESNMQTEAEQHQAKGYMNALLNLFLPSQDSRSNINTDPYSVGY